MAADAGWWAADPTGRHHLRYWDGSAWTAWVSDRGAPFVDPQQWVPPGPMAVPPPPAGAPAVFSSRAVPTALVGILASVVASRLVVDNVPSFSSAMTARVLLFYVLLFGGLLLTCATASARFGTGNPRADFGVAWRANDAGWGVLAFIGTLIVSNWVSAFWLGIGAVNDSATHYKDTVDTITGTTFVVWVFFGVAVAPVVEEMVFRGLLLRSLTPAVGATPAVIGQAVAFGAYHLSPALGLFNLVYFTSTTVFALAVGWIAVKRGRLGIGITAHICTNAFLFAVLLATR
jgi:membrane protease YdiL (CAAX protease family)